MNKKNLTEMRAFIGSLKDMSTTAPKTQAIVDKVNAFIDERYSQGDTANMEYLFNGVAAALSRYNIEQGNGGPFGAVVVEYDKVDGKGQGVGKPRLLGVGANHVVSKKDPLQSDPTAHAEMEAYRDASKRRNASDLKNTVLFTSCECCPMCLANAYATGVEGITFSNTKDHANRINFSDEEQYKMFQLERGQQMTRLDKLAVSEQEKKELQAKLGDAGAVVLDKDGNVYAAAKTDTRTDPTGAASLKVIRNAVKKHAHEVNGAALTRGENPPPVFGVPEGSKLILAEIPFPGGVVASDWSNLLREFGGASTDAPATDNRGWGQKAIKSSRPNPVDPTRIVHVSDSYEQLPVFDKDGKSRIAHTAEAIYAEMAKPVEERSIPTKRYGNFEINSYNQKTFLEWDRDMNQIRY